MWRAATAAIGALFLAGCSAEQRPVAGIGLTSLAPTPVSELTSHSEAEAIEAATEARIAGRRSMASKVLAAIALERVTGRKPDPARLADAR